MISPQAESSAESTTFTNSVTSLLAQAIRHDTTTAASPVMKLISFVHMRVHVKIGGWRAAADWISSLLPKRLEGAAVRLRPLVVHMLLVV